MTKIRFKIFPYLIIVLSIIIVSCKTKKEVSIPQEIHNAQRKEYIKTEKLYEYVLANEISYNNLNIKLSAEVQINDQKQDFSAIVRIQKDSIIWISFRKLNFEGIRICITQDSVKLIDRMNEKYYQENYKTFAENMGFDLDYKSFQSIFTNSFFFYPCSDAPDLINNFKLCSDEDNYCVSSLSKKRTSKYFNNKLTSEKWNRNLEKENLDTLKKGVNDTYIFQIVKIKPRSFKIANVFLENYIDQQSVYIEYDNFINKFNQNYPKKIKLNLSTKQIRLIAKLTITDISFNPNNLTFPFKISNKMEKIEY